MPASAPPGARKMAQQGKALTVQVWKPKFNPWKPHTKVKRETQSLEVIP